MSQFYIASESNANRCRDSQISRTVITISGLTLKGKVQFFTGVGQSVDDDTKRHVQKR
jgi:hypothetical protein